MEAHLGKMEFFCKLGYGKQDICKVLENLGQGALEDDVLKELIRVGSRPVAQERQAQHPLPKLVPRGSCSSAAVPKQPEEEASDSSSHLRPIVIDGSNIAMSHGNKEVFSCRGIQLAVDWFRERGHKDIKVFVPSWRKEPPRFDSPITDQHILDELAKQTILVYTPSRKVKGRRVVCYDDRYIIKVAHEKDGVIVSNDNYRDLQSENPEWKWFIEQRLLMYSFVSDKFMPPDDPLGRHGPTLYNFLSKKPVLPFTRWQPCPYGKKCTYGSKCKFFHPERQYQAQLSVADELRAKTKASSRSLGTEEETLKAAPATTQGGTASRGVCIERLQESSGATGGGSSSSTQSFATDWFHSTQQERSYTEHSARAWGDRPLCKLEHEQNVLPQDLQREQRLMEKQLSALSLMDKLYSANRLADTSEREDATDSTHQCCNLSHNHCHNLYATHHNHSLDCLCLQQCKLPSPLHRHPAHFKPEHCSNVQMSAVQSQRIQYTVDRSLSTQGLQAQQQVIHTVRSPLNGPFPYSKREDGQYQRHLQNQPPIQSFLLDSHKGPGSFSYLPTSHSEYLPNHAPEPLAGERAHIRSVLCSVFPYDEVDRVMFLYPDLKDMASLILLIQRHRLL